MATFTGKKCPHCETNQYRQLDSNALLADCAYCGMTFDIKDVLLNLPSESHKKNSDTMSSLESLYNQTTNRNKRDTKKVRISMLIIGISISVLYLLEELWLRNMYARIALICSYVLLAAITTLVPSLKEKNTLKAIWNNCIDGCAVLNIIFWINFALNYLADIRILSPLSILSALLFIALLFLTLSFISYFMMVFIIFIVSALLLFFRLIFTGIHSLTKRSSKPMSSENPTNSESVASAKNNIS